MNTGIGPSGADQFDLLSEYRRNRFFNCLLHTFLSWLNLPAEIVFSVVSQFYEISQFRSFNLQNYEFYRLLLN